MIEVSFMFAVAAHFCRQPHDNKTNENEAVNWNFWIPLRLRQQLTKTQKEVEELKQSNEDLMGDVDGYINQESEHLKFSQRLSDETVRLQSENLALGDEVEKHDLSSTVVIMI